jgi:hypothetical protein
MRLFLVLLVVIVIVALISAQEVPGMAATGEGSEAPEGTKVSQLLESVLRGDVDGIEQAIEEYQESIDTVNVNGWSGAHFAVSAGNMEVLSALINMGIDLNLVDDRGYTALMMAAGQVRCRLLVLLKTIVVHGGLLNLFSIISYVAFSE